MNNNTKIKSLMAQINSGKIKNDAARILKFIINHDDATRPMICDMLGMLTQTVTARLADLQDLGIVNVQEHGFDAEYNIYYYEPNVMGQVKNAYDRRKLKFEQWKRRGVDEFSDFLHQDQLELNL